MYVYVYVCMHLFRVGSWVVVRVKEFLLGRSQRVRVGGHLSEEVRVR